MATYEDFQQYKQRLAEGVCYQLYNIVQDCHSRYANVGFDCLLQDVEKVNQKLRSHRFRIAIIGEFSRGKSTLVNALVGEQIQPVRAVACSGTITVLRYGERKRVICHYKDGRAQEVPIEDYQNLVAISRDAARKYISDELARAQIEEVVFEHPNLALCRNGVEIVDSPGLNEHPERERITKKLIEDADAVIFLLLASQILTQSERELLRSIKNILCDGKEKEAANNLFLAVNKVDELNSEEDWQDVRDVVEGFAFGENLIPQVRDRIHYISAKESFRDCLKGDENDTMKMFRKFVDAIERFSSHERGRAETSFCSDVISTIFNDFIDRTNVISKERNNNLSKKELKKKEILEELGELAGIIQKILDSTQQSAKQAKSEFLAKLKASWEEWLFGLHEDMLSNSKTWRTSENNAGENPDRLINEYIQCFRDELQKNFEDWLNENEKSLEECIKLLDSEIYIKHSILIRYGTLKKQPLFSGRLDANFDLNKDGRKDIFARLYYNLGFENILNIVKLDVFQIKRQVAKKIRRAVLKEGYKTFCGCSDKIYQSMELAVNKTFLSQLNALESSLEQEMASCEQRLERCDRAYQTALQEYETEKAWLDHKRQELDRVRQELETLLNQLPKSSEPLSETGNPVH